MYAQLDQFFTLQNLELRLTLQILDDDDDFRHVTEIRMLAERSLEPSVCTFYEELSGENEGVVSTVAPMHELKNAPVSIGRYLCKAGLSYNPLLLRLEAILASSSYTDE